MRKVSFLLVGTFIFTAAAVAQNEFQFKEAGSQTVFMQRLGGPESEAGFVFMDMAEGNQVVKGAPYTATAITETTQVLADGNRISHKNTASLARDGQGRTRREETIGKMGPVPVDGAKMVIISDPVTHVNYFLRPGEDTAQAVKGKAIKIISTEGGKGDTQVVRIEGSKPEGVETRIEARKPKGVEARIEARKHAMMEVPGEVKHESLGTQTIEGVACEGTRDTRTIPAGAIGNERPIEIVSESWTSTDLHVLVLRKRSDPRFGETTYRLTNIKLGEPDPALFQVPANYKTIIKGESPML